MNRRNFLRGLLATAAVTVLRDDRVLTLLPQGRFESYTSYFRWDPVIPLGDWRYVVRIANIELKEQPAAAIPNMFTYISAAA